MTQARTYRFRERTRPKCVGNSRTGAWMAYALRLVRLVLAPVSMLLNIFMSLTKPELKFTLQDLTGLKISENGLPLQLGQVSFFDVVAFSSCTHYWLNLDKSLRSRRTNPIITPGVAVHQDESAAMQANLTAVGLAQFVVRLTASFLLCNNT